MLTHGPITEHTKVSLAFTVSGFTVHWLFFMLNNHPPNLLSFTPFPSKVPFKKSIPSPFLDFDLHISYHVSRVISFMYCLLHCEDWSCQYLSEHMLFSKLQMSSYHTRCTPTGAIRAGRQKSWQREEHSPLKRSSSKYV